MNSSKSSPKHANKVSFKPVPPFDMFYQLTYMSAMAAAGITRSKTFELAARSRSLAAVYFEAVNTLVDEMRLDYPEACRRVGNQAKSENMKSFLLRLSDALRSGEPLAEFLAREAEIMGEDYQNHYERNLESLKQWSSAYSSIVISVALIVIIQIMSSMIYSTDLGVMSGLVFTGGMMSGFSAWIIWRSAPQEVMTVKPSDGSPEQRRAMQLFRMLGPIALMAVVVLAVIGVPTGMVLVVVSASLLPVGIIANRSDKKTRKKDVEFSTFLRSTGGMATSSGTTLKESLTKIDLSSFPTLQEDIQRLSTRLQALVDPALCWHKFGLETGSKLISEVVAIFYSAILIGGDPERVGYLCSLFTAKTSQLRAKRKLVAGTFSGMTAVMQAVIAMIMIFVLSIVQNFAALVSTLMPTDEAAVEGQASMNLGMAQFTPAELQFLSSITVAMIVILAMVGAAAIILTDGGFKLKFAFFLALTIFVSGISFFVVPPMVAGILSM